MKAKRLERRCPRCFSLIFLPGAKLCEPCSMLINDPLTKTLLKPKIRGI